MNRLVIIGVLLSVLLFGGCMEEAMLTPYTTDKHPFVQCILYPDSTVQYLHLSYVRQGDGPAEPITDADISLFRNSRRYWNVMDSVGSFYHIDGELWGYQFDDPLQPYDKYLLQIVLPSRDTLIATTTIPYEYETDSHQQSSYAHRLTGGHRPRLINFRTDDSRLPDYTTGYQIEYYVDPDLVDRENVSLFTIWAWKMDWNERTSSYEIAGTLATDQENNVDSFNLTGDYFTEADQPGILESFPQVVGKPLHYKYLRIPVGYSSFKQDYWIAGNFKGPHYKDPILGPEMANSDVTIPPELAYLFPDIERGPKGYVSFLYASEELDAFIKDTIREQMLSETGIDLSIVYRNTNHYTNIKSSTTVCAGVFGAAYEQHLWWSYVQPTP